MKNLIAIVVSLSLALMIGCQENLITDPENSVLFKGKEPEVKSLKISCEVKDLTYGVCNLKGRVNYTHEVTSKTMNPRQGLYEISVSLYINAVLSDRLGIAHLEWRVEARSNDIVTVSEDGILILEKCYSISNRTDVVLLVKYLVTTNGVGIASIDLVPLERKFQ